MSRLPPASVLVTALLSLAEDRTLPRRRVRIAKDMADRISRPARLSLLGLPSGGQGALANALLGTDLLGPDWPTTRLFHGPELTYEATLATRQTLRGEGLPDPGSLPAAAALLDLWAPLELLNDLSLLVLRAGDDWQSQQGALLWAAPQTDIALWCSAGLTPQELQIWQAAPQAVTNHGFLLCPGAPPPSADPEFAAHVDTADPEWPDLLRSALTGLIEDARTEDAAVAAMFLEDLGIRLDRLEAAEERSQAPAPAPQAPYAVSSSPPADPGTVRDDAAWKSASRLLLTLRRGASEILDRLANGPDEAELATDLLDRAETLLDGLQDVAGQDPDTNPDLAAIFAEASETVILLKYEGGFDQAQKAAWVLGQVRQDIETHLEQAA